MCETSGQDRTFRPQIANLSQQQALHPGAAKGNVAELRPAEVIPAEIVL
jgi:hypothetical protein